MSSGARLASVMKGGAYPLNAEWIPMVANLFKPSKNKGRILDPFSNTGDAVEFFGNALNLTPFTIEINEVHGKVAQEKFGLTRALIDDAYEVTISQESFPFVYLNPPYDKDITMGVAENSLNRAEYKALSRFWKPLQFDGYMVMAIYAHHMSRSIGRQFFTNCNKIDIYRFPEPHLDHYNQVLIVGRRHNDKKVPDPDWIEARIQQFAELGKHPEKIRDITRGVKPPKDAPEDFDPRYEIPPTRFISHMLFTPKKIDPEAFLKLHQRYGAHRTSKFLEVVTPPKEEERIQPIAKPRFGQLAVMIASGLLDGIRLTHKGKKAVVRGSVKRVYAKYKEETELDEHGNEKIIEYYRNSPQTNIVILMEDGTRENITTDDKLIEFIKEHQPELMEYFTEMYKPAYDMQIDDIFGEIYDEHLVMGDKPLLPTQEHVSTASTEHLLFHRNLIIVGEPSVGKTAMATAIVASLAKAEKLKRTEKDKLSNICKRYKKKLSNLSGLKPGDVVLVVCPAILPQKWISEISLMYPEAYVTQLKTTVEAHQFFDRAQNSSEVHIGILTYEDLKLGEGWESQYQIKNEYSWEYEYKNGTEQRIAKKTPKAIDPRIGEKIKVVVGHDWKDIPLNKLNSRQWFYTGGYQRGWKWEVDELGKKKRVPDMVAIYNSRVPKDEAFKNRRHLSLPLFSDIRTLGLPKLGNGRVIPFERIVPTSREDRWHPVFTTKWVSGIQTKVLTGYKNIGPSRGTVISRSIQENLVPNEEILNEWIALKGMRCTTSSHRKNKIDRELQKHELTYYRYGGGNAKLDALLKHEGIPEYHAGTGYTVYRNPRYPLASYIARRYGDRIGLLIVDEIHKIKGVDTDQGVESRLLIYKAKKVLGLTGTLYGGVASSIYTIEFALNKRVQKRFPWIRGNSTHWNKAMGIVEDVFVNANKYSSNGQITGNQRYAKSHEVERPGCSPMLVRELLDHCVFVGLGDLGGYLPVFSEIPEEVQMDARMSANYEVVVTKLRDYNKGCLIAGDGSFTGSYYRNSLSLPDSMHRENIVLHRTVKDRDARRKEYYEAIVMTTPNIGDYVKPKEKRLQELIEKFQADKRRTIVFVSQTRNRDIQDRIKDVISEVEGTKPFILKDVTTEDRITYIDKKVADGFNVMICNPKLVQEGVNLIAFSRTIYIEVEPSLTVMGQSSRRTWRLNQPEPDVEVWYLYYNDIFQQAAVFSIGAKTAAANVLYGTEGSSLSALSEDETIYETIGKIIEEGLTLDEEAIKNQFNNAAYSIEDWLKSSWYAEPRKRKAIQPKVVVQSIPTKAQPEFVVPVQDSLLDLLGEMDW